MRCRDLIAAVEIAASRRHAVDGLAPPLDVLFNHFEIIQWSIVGERMRRD